MFKNVFIVALTGATLLGMVACNKSSADDFDPNSSDNPQESPEEKKEKLQNWLDQGEAIVNVYRDGENISIQTSEGSSIQLKSASGKSATLLTISDDGFWIINNEQTNYRAKPSSSLKSLPTRSEEETYYKVNLQTEKFVKVTSGVEEATNISITGKEETGGLIVVYDKFDRTLTFKGIDGDLTAYTINLTTCAIDLATLGVTIRNSRNGLESSKQMIQTDDELTITIPNKSNYVGYKIGFATASGSDDDYFFTNEQGLTNAYWSKSGKDSDPNYNSRWVLLVNSLSTNGNNLSLKVKILQRPFNENDIACITLTFICDKHEDRIASILLNTQMKAYSYSISANGGSFPPGPKEYDKGVPSSTVITGSIEPGKTLPIPELTSQTIQSYYGYYNTTLNFKGWYRKIQSNYQPFDFNTPITSDVDIYANWQPESCADLGIRNEKGVPVYFYKEPEKIQFSSGESEIAYNVLKFCIPHEEAEICETYPSNSSIKNSGNIISRELFQKLLQLDNKGWINLNGQYGYKFSKGNESIFLPAASYYYSDYDSLTMEVDGYNNPIYDYHEAKHIADGEGYYWTSTEKDSTNIYYLHFDASSISVENTEKIMLVFNNHDYFLTLPRPKSKAFPCMTYYTSLN